jgi:hypothetical protein
LVGITASPSSESFATTETNSNPQRANVWSAGARWEPEKITAAGDFVLAAVYGHGSGRGSGAPVEVRFFQVFEMRDRKVQRIWSCFDEEEALEAAGLRE